MKLPNALASFLLATSLCSAGLAQVENVVLITMDGLRPEEFFGGADERLMLPELGVKDVEQTKLRYRAESRESKREKLLPFLWGRVNKGGWTAGDLLSDSVVKVTNGRYFSYPGYSELLCGFPDEAIDSNAKLNNKNKTVLEYLNNEPDFIGSVLAFCSWDVFPFIINEDRSGIPVNAGWVDLELGDPANLRVLNHCAENLFHEWESVRYDVFTASGAIEALKSEQPRVLYVSLGETDDWAHAGRYDRYLLTATQNDGFIKRIWSTTQSMPQYKDKTAFIVTTDHGRGDGREGWKNHSAKLPGSDRIWVVAFGAGVERSGIDRGGRYTQSQMAATVAGLLGHDYREQDTRIAAPLPINQK